MLLVFFVAYVLGRIITTVLSKLSEKLSRSGRIKVKMIIPATKFVIYILVFYYVLREIFKIFGPELFLLTGLLGAAIGFGIKDLFADFVGGVVITFEKPYHIGDKITIGNYYGEVTDIGLRATKLVTPDDNTVTAPNSLIFNETVASGNYGISGNDGCNRSVYCRRIRCKNRNEDFAGSCRELEICLHFRKKPCYPVT